MTYRTFAEGRASEDFVIFFDDFTSFAAADWTITTTEAGSGDATEALSTALTGGVLVITNDDADNDNDFLQLDRELFLLSTEKAFQFKARFKVNDATDSDLVLGLQITDTTPLAVSDGVYFRKDDGDANLDFVVVKDSTATTLSAVGELADDTWHVVEFYYNGSGSIAVYLDGARVGAAAMTNLPDDELLAVSFGIQNGEAAAKVLSIDYVKVAQER